jgi:hypothetical protein
MSQPAFGHRPSLPDSGGQITPTRTPPASRSDARSWPVRIDKQLGVPPLMLFGPYLLLAAISLLPPLLSGLSVTYVLFQTSTGLIQLGMGAGLALLCLATRRRGELTLDADGVDVQAGAQRSFYAWADIEHLDELKGGVKVSLHGRTAEQNQYNIINARFMPSAGALRQLLSDGQAHYARERRSSRRTVAPGDDLRQASLRGAALALGVIAAPMLLVVGPTATWAVLDCMKTLDLQKFGVRTEATVTRIYTDGCGRRSCSIDAQFTFPVAGQTFSGHGYLASDRDPTDPDLVYAKRHGSVPIAYDARRPRVVGLNFGDRIFHEDAVHGMWSLIGIVGAITGSLTLCLSLCILPSLLRAFRRPPGPSWTDRVDFTTP